jgi:carboxylesterase
MERYEMLNKIASPLDYAMALFLDGLKKVGLYEQAKEKGYEATRALLRKNFESVFGVEVEGEENVPKEGGCIIACNHQSWLDVQVLFATSPRRYYFIAKSDFKEWPILSRLIELSDSLYIRRGGDDEGLRAVADAIKQGKAVVIFPEGTIPGEEDIPRWDVEPDTLLLKGKTGVVRLQLMTGAPIIPCGISGTGKAFPPEMYPRLEILPPIPKPCKITIRYGEPIKFEKKEATKEELEKMTKEVMRAISRLVDHERGFVPMSQVAKKKTKPEKVPRYAYIKRHEGEEKAPIGVLVLHGFTSDIHCVDLLVEPLDKLGVPYRFPWLRGHGTHYKDMVGTTDRDWYEDAENALLDLLQDAKKVIVVGLSMGGLLALELAGRYREEVAGVVAVAAALKFKDPLAVLTPVLSKVVKFWNSPNAFNDLELKKKENRNYPKFATDAFASLYRYASQVQNLLSFVKADILILHSKKDQIIAPKSAQIIYEKVSSKNKEIKWFEKSGHEMLLDLERDDVIKTVADFISAHIS